MAPTALETQPLLQAARTAAVKETSSAASAQLRADLAPIIIPPSSKRARYVNWARSYAAEPVLAFEPTTEAQCAAILQLAELEGRVVRAVGAGHSPSDLPCTNDFMLRMDKLCSLVDLDVEKRTVTVQAGMTVQALNDLLHNYDLALPNLGSISDTSIGGIISTGTHGSGLSYGILATHVLSLSLMLADGSVLFCSREENADVFMATLCGLGTTGLITRVKWQVTKAFRLKEIREVRRIDDVIEDLGAWSRKGEYVRLWWSPQTNLVSVMYADRTDDPIDATPANMFTPLLNFLAGPIGELILYLGIFLPFLTYLANIIKSRIGIVPGVFVGRSDAILNVDCGYTQYTTEWNIPLQEAKQTLRELSDWVENLKAGEVGAEGDAKVGKARTKWEGPSFPIEIRFSKEDDIWLSPAYGRTSCWIGIVKYKPYAHPVPFSLLSSQFSTILANHGGRPHWAKTHSFSPSGLRALYPRFQDFIGVVERLDPRGRFRNEYIRRHLFGEDVDGGYRKSV